MSPSPPSDLPGLIGEVEHRLTGAGTSCRLDDGLAGELPDAPTYVVVLFDGLGVAQLEHEAAGSFRETLRGVIGSPFPTTTSVALSSVATGLRPVDHGLISHLTWIPELDQVVNTLKWVDLSGRQVGYDYASVLPRPNLWERLRSAGVEPITVQPDSFSASPLSRMLYRGARFEGVWDSRDQVEATVQLAAAPGRFIFTYLWEIDYAGHVHGLASPEFTEAIKRAASIWDELRSKLGPGAVLLGTADHGLVEYTDADKLIVRDERFSGMRFAGDPRGVQVWGEIGLIDEFAAVTGGVSVDPAKLYDGTAPTTAGDRIVLAPPGKVILPPGFDKRLRAYHGGLDPAEAEIPFLVG